jgi:predicted lactoylglutathione lyase
MVNLNWNEVVNLAGISNQWGFQDLDGHLWEVFWMDPNAQKIG